VAERAASFFSGIPSSSAQLAVALILVLLAYNVIAGSVVGTFSLRSPCYANGGVGNGRRRRRTTVQFLVFAPLDPLMKDFLVLVGGSQVYLMPVILSSVDNRVKSLQLRLPASILTKLIYPFTFGLASGCNHSSGRRSPVL
jgi:hypothetical protein